MGEHDGYMRLRDPVLHRRTVTLDGRRMSVVVVDEIVARGRHELELNFHLAENCAAEAQGSNSYRVSAERGSIEIAFDSRLTAQRFHGSSNPIRGWVSRGYQRKVPSTILTATATIVGSVRISTHIAVAGANLGPDKMRYTLPVYEE